MATKAKKEETDKIQGEVIIEVFTEEQLNILDQDTKDSVVFLTEKFKPSELMILNPVVSKLLKLKEYEKIVYDPEKPETVAQYKEAIKEIGSFNTMAKNAKSEMKRPIDDIGSKILSIEKSVLKSASEIKTSLEKNFKKYIDEQKKIADEKQKKKDEKANEKLNEVTKEKDDAVSMMTKSTVINKIKYDIPNEIEGKVYENLDKYSLEALQKLNTELFAENYVQTHLVNSKIDTTADIANGVYTLEEANAALNIYSSRLLAIKKALDNKIILLQNNITDTAPVQGTVFETIPVKEASPAEAAGNLFMGGFTQNSPTDNLFQRKIADKILTPAEFLIDVEMRLKGIIDTAEKVYVNSEASPERKTTDAVKVLLTKVLTYLNEKKDGQISSN